MSRARARTAVPMEQPKAGSCVDPEARVSYDGGLEMNWGQGA